MPCLFSIWRETAQTSRNAVRIPGQGGTSHRRSKPGTSGQVEEKALARVIEIRQVVGEIGEVIADADARVFVDMPENVRQRSLQHVARFFRIDIAVLARDVPFMDDVVIDAADGEPCRAAEPEGARNAE